MNDPNASPINALPRVVILLAVALAGPELVFWLSKSGLMGGTPGGDDMRIYAIRQYAFVGEVFERLFYGGAQPVDVLLRFVSYPFIHATFLQAVFVLVFVLALGKMVGEVLSGFTVVAVFFGAAIFGAIVFALVWGADGILIGGFPAAYGLIGAYTYILWVGYGAVGESQMRAFSLIGMLMGIQLLFGLFFGGSGDWVADLGGFAAGFVLTVVARPGGLRQILLRLRR